MRTITIAYLLVIHAVLFAVAAKKITRAASAKSGQSELTDHYHSMTNYFGRQDALVPDGAVVFIGDSHIQGLYTYTIAPITVNYGIGRDTTVGVLSRIPASVQRARAVILLVGINDFLNGRTPEQITTNYAAILDRLPASTVAVGLLHVREASLGGEAKASGVTNAKIDELNRHLASLCSRRGIRFVIPPAELFDSAGQLRPEISEPDGVHLNASGYRIFADHLRSHLTTSN